MDRVVVLNMSNAIQKGDISTVESLIMAYGLNYSDNWSEGFNLLNAALTYPRNSERPEIALILLSHGAKVNTTDTSTSSTSTPLHYASSGVNNVEVVKQLLARGATVNASDVSGQTPLHLAVRIQREGYLNYQIIHLLLSSGADVNATNYAGRTPLLYAIEQRDSQELVEMLIKHCTNINFISSVEKYHFTPLQYAVRNGKKEVVELLLEYGADVNISTKDGETALHMSVKTLFHGCLMAEFLINRGADVNAVFTSGKFEGCSPLHIAASEPACSHNKVKVIELLLTHGANVNAASKDHSTPLHMGAFRCDEVQFELLLKHGADPNILTKDNKTVLRIAVEKGSSKIVQYILKYSPDLNNDLHADILRVALFDNQNFSHDIIRQLLDYGFSVANEPKKASMFYEALKEGSTAIVEELLNHGFDVNKQYKFKSGWSFMPLHLAVHKNRLSEARLLISHGADLNALDKAGNTPISYVCLKDFSKSKCWESTSFQMLTLLLEKGAKPKDNPALLPFASQYHYTEAIQLLLDHGVDVNERDSSGLTALHRVFFRLVRERFQKDFKSSLQFAELLLEKKADVNAKTKTDIAVLHIATLLDPQYLEFLQTLLEYNADVDIRCDTVTPLHVCAIQSNVVFCRVLLNKGANANAKLEDGQTAAHLVVAVNDFYHFETCRKFKRAFECFKESETSNLFTRMGNENHDFELIEALAEFGADLNVKDVIGKSPLHGAAENRFKGDMLIPILIQHGADWTSRDKHLKTPLHYAAQGSMRNVRILVEFGADINSKDVDGCSPLHRLVQSGSADVTVLLKLGSDINVVNNDNHTPLEIAVLSPDFMRTHKQKVIKDLKTQIIKLKVANFHVDFKNLVLESWDLEGDDFYNDYYCECKREMDRIRAELIGESNVSFHDLLTSGREELIRLAKNDKLVKALEIEDFRKFPIYAPEFKLKVLYLKQAPRRSSLLEKSNEVFVICIADLPDLCVDKVLDHLSDDDLENLVRVHYPFEVFPKTNDSKCQGYLSDYDDYEIDHDDDYDYDDRDCYRLSDDSYYEESNGMDSDGIDSICWRRWT